MKVMKIVSLFVCLGVCVQVAEAALTDDLVAYYAADGDMTDSSGNGHDGTAASGTAVYGTGKIGQAFQFANNWMVDCGAWDIDPTDTDNFSLSFWVMKTNAGDYAGILSKKNDSDESFFFDLKNTSSDQAIDFKAGVYLQPGGGFAPVNEWHHMVCLVGADGSGEIYIDGVSRKTRTGMSVADKPDVALILGNKKINGGNKWNGYLDEVAIWNRVITADEIAKLYNNGKGLPVSKEAVNIAPEKGEEFVVYTPSLDLEWGAGGAAEIGEVYTLYFDDSNDISSPLYSEMLVYDGNDMSVTITDYVTLSDATAYYWVVDDPNGPGEIWSFTTKTSLYISGQPVDALGKMLGDDVDFTVEVVADNGITSVDWRRMVDDANSVSVWVDTSGNAISTLSFSNLNGTEEGDYFAVVTDGVAAQVTSDIVTLEIMNDLLAWWEFSDLSDSAGTDTLKFYVTADGQDGGYGSQNDGAATYDANAPFDDAINLDGTGNYIMDSEDLQPDADTGQFTVLAWIKWKGVIQTNAKDRQSIVDTHHYDGGAQGFTFLIDETTSKLGVVGDYNGSHQTASVTVPTDEWIQAVLISDGSNVKIYQNGVKVLDQAYTIVPKPNSFKFEIGGGTARDRQNFYGSIDDIKIYNYQLGIEEIAYDYYLGSGNFGCGGNPQFDTSGPEGSPDCKVDLYDFVDFAGAWLDCNRIPADSCN